MDLPHLCLLGGPKLSEMNMQITNASRTTFFHMTDMRHGTYDFAEDLSQNCVNEVFRIFEKGIFLKKYFWSEQNLSFMSTFNNLSSFITYMLMEVVSVKAIPWKYPRNISKYNRSNLILKQCIGIIHCVTMGSCYHGRHGTLNTDAVQTKILTLSCFTVSWHGQDKNFIWRSQDLQCYRISVNARTMQPVFIWLSLVPCSLVICRFAHPKHYVHGIIIFPTTH